MDEERIRALEKTVTQLEERDKQREKDLSSLSQKLWAVAAAVLLYVGNQLMGLIGTLGP